MRPNPFVFLGGTVCQLWRHLLQPAHRVHFKSFMAFDASLRQGWVCLRIIYVFTILSRARRMQFDKDPQLHRHTANEVLPTAGCEGSREPTRRRADRLL